MERCRPAQLVFLTVLMTAAALLVLPLAASAQNPPSTVAILPLFDTVSEVGKDFSEADLQPEMTRLRTQGGENQGRVKVGFSHVCQISPSVPHSRSTDSVTRSSTSFPTCSVKRTIPAFSPSAMSALSDLRFAAALHDWAASYK